MSERRFERLSKDKIAILNELIANKEIVQAVGCDEPNFLDESNLINDPETLVWNKIFPYKYVPSLTQDRSTFITLGFSNYGATKGQQFKSGLITFYIFCHNDLQKTDTGFLRTDYITHQIDKLFGRTYKVGGIGKIEFVDMSDLSINEQYHGNRLTYRVYEWM